MVKAGSRKLLIQAIALEVHRNKSEIGRDLPVRLQDALPLYILRRWVIHFENPHLVCEFFVTQRERIVTRAEDHILAGPCFDRLHKLIFGITDPQDDRGVYGTVGAQYYVSDEPVERPVRCDGTP